MIGFRDSDLRLEENNNNKKDFSGANSWENSEELLYISDIKSEKDIKLALCDIIGSIFKSHKSLS